ncbi:LPS export ABC transporter periplasmic protein LptC [Azoarcus sp. DD4]|uniref:LPS export ABC transporter periplasmic protein LptC n=1 Tax=Azoarcus sp. DD4 TaxID=2027405 RepID=UPI00112BE9CA|nr:LPS export ABC transporter periplasmic protein LptC [Azoarcus sp. DD4]QDF95916.1 LPS export ABC transporter periplasmic protein LptC [Azoarcus sp. DD4]
MQTAYRLYPVIALALLAGASVWLERVSRDEAPSTVARQQTGPDFVAEQARIVGFGADGSQRYELDSERIAHFPQGDITRVALPRLVLTSEGRATRITAAQGEVSPGGERVDLSGSVRVRRGGDGNGSDLSLDTETLSLWPDDHRAESQSPVSLVQGRNTAQALGLRANNLFGTLELIGQARVHLPRRQGNPS